MEFDYIVSVPVMYNTTSQTKASDGQVYRTVIRACCQSHAQTQAMRGARASGWLIDYNRIITSELD